jgi:hypothetical protein
MKKILLLCFSYLFIFNLLAQDQDRIEFDAENALGNKYYTYPIGENGLILMYQPAGKEKGKSKDNGFTLKKLDVNFKEVGKGTFSPPKGFTLDEVVTDANNLYAMFSPSANFKNYAVFKIDKQTLKSTVYLGEYPKHLDYNSMQVLNGIVYLGFTAGPNPNTATIITCVSMPLCFIPLLFYNPKYYSMVTSLDFNKKVISKKEYQLGGGKGLKIEFIDMSKNDSLNKLDLLLSLEGKKETRNILREISGNTLDKEKVFKLTGGKELATGKVFSTGPQTKVVLGQYKNKRGQSRKERKEAAKKAPGGIFISGVDNGKQTFTKLIPFSSFKNFTISIPKSDKKKGKSNNKREEAQSLGLQSIISFTFHDLLIREDEMLVFAEPYYPTYHTETRVVFVNGRATTQTVTVFDGYKFLGAMVMAFDMEGNMKWENGFKISDGPLSFSTSRKFDFYETEDQGIKVVYNNAGSIFSKTIYNDKVDSEVELMKVKAAGNNKKVKNLDSRYTEVNGTEYWYDNFYLAFGMQKITSDTKAKDRAKDEKKNRTIFYLNKIEIEE